MKATSLIKALKPQAILRWLSRLRAGAAVFLYLMLGLTPAMADDIDIYTKNIASGGGGSPVIVFQIDSSGSMLDEDTSDNTASRITKQRKFLVRDAARGQVTGMPGRFKVGLFRYSGSTTGSKLADAKAMNTVLATTATPTGGTYTYPITTGQDDVAQIDAASPVRYGEGDLRLTEYETPPNLTQVNIPFNGAWAGSGGQVWDNTATSVGNVVFWYYHTSNSTTSQTITLNSTGAPAIDTYLYFVNAAGDTLLASNDDTTPDGYSCPSTWTLQMTVPGGEPTTPAAPRCKRYCSNKDVNGPPASAKVAGCTKVNQNNYIAATYVAGNLNSTLTVTGLVNGQWYKIIAATFSPGQTGPFSLNLSNPTRGQLWRETVGSIKYDQRVGLRFSGLEIPNGANITNAYIQFQSLADNSGSTKVAPGIDKKMMPNDFRAEGLYTRDVNWDDYVSLNSWSNGESGSDTRLNVTDLVKDQVGDDEWCGGDMVFLIKGDGVGSALRIAHAFESNTGTEPRLVIQWTAGASSNPCYRRKVTMDIKSISEDVAQGATGAMTFDGNNLPISSTQKAGLRFSLVPLPGGLVVEDARLQLTAYATTTARPIFIDAINEPVAKPFGSSTSALDARDTLGNAVGWTPADWVVGQSYTSPNLKDLIQPLMDDPAWEYDGTIGLILTGTNASPIAFRAWERHMSGDSSNSVNESDYGQFSARLTLTVRSDEPIPVQSTHRAFLVQQLNGIPASGSTPISGAFIEVSQYLLGMDGYTLPELASGDCATNTTVVLTDGDENGSYNNTAHINATKAITGQTCTIGIDPNTGGEEGWDCTYDLMDTLFNGTKAASDGNKYSVRTYTIGFGPVAYNGGGKLAGADAHGGGKYYPATNAAALVNVFQEIVSSMVDGGASIAAPGVAVNALNKFEHLDELYYALFKPSTRVAWKGNLKRYRLKNSVIVDVDADPAIDPDTARFDVKSESFWSATGGMPMEDGVVVTRGGAAGEIIAPDTDRRLYTYMGTYGTSMNQNLYVLGTPAVDGVAADSVQLTNSNITPQVVGVDLMDGYATMGGTAISGKRDEVITFLRGGTNTVPRLEFGSAIHSAPTLVTYGKDGAGLINTVFLSDNEGVLHMIDTGNPSSDNATTNRANTGGKELFSFVPKELLKNATLLQLNSRSVSTDGYIYGLDGSWITVKIDKNGDETISGADDKVYLFGGMRRGGKNYYGLDVSTVNRRDRNAGSMQPKLMWVIEGGKTGTPYANMGQSWSVPVARVVKWNGAARRVLFFGGGYDTWHDDNQPFNSATQKGSAVYMVDMLTGELLWWASAQTGASTSVPQMKYSITASPVPMDRDGDGYTDGMYIVDLAGQVFRFDLSQQATGASSFVRYTALAGSFGGAAAGADPVLDNLRFYEAPAVALIEEGGTDLMLALTSGYRERPSSVATRERLVMFKDYDAWKVAPAAQTTVTVADLPKLPASGELSAADQVKKGWYMDFEQAVGEKGTGTPLFFDFILLFTTYVPKGTISDLQCTPDIGYSRLYVMHALTGAGLVDPDFPNVSGDLRFIDQTLPGLSPGVQMLRIGDETTLLTGTTSFDAAEVSDSFSEPFGTFRRTRWFETDE